MHIPDGFLNTASTAACWAAAAGSIGYGVKRASRELDERSVPLMGVSSAFIFAAQMINFAVVGGTSGHLLGGALAAILLGPWSGMLVITSVLTIQALLFQDGGLLALGANVFNMAVVGVLIGWISYRGLGALLRRFHWGHYVAGFAAGWLSVVGSALLAAVELAVSGASPWHIVVPAVFTIHALIGIGEGLITVGVIGFLSATRPDLLRLRTASAEA